MTSKGWADAHFTIHDANGTTRDLTLKGRQKWALMCLIHAGPRGCTPIDQPGPRWSAYVFSLRREFGLDIETIHEKHGPPFEGTHARYVLHNRVTAADGVTQ